MLDLLYSLLMHNDDGPRTGFPGLSNEANQIYQEAGNSKEFRKLEKAIMEAEEKRKGIASAPAKTEAAEEAVSPLAQKDPLANQRARIDDFLRKIRNAGHTAKRKDIWIAAGYRQAKDFEQFQRGNVHTTRSARGAFERVLSMSPEDFVALVQRKKAAQTAAH